MRLVQESTVNAARRVVEVAPPPPSGSRPVESAPGPGDGLPGDEASGATPLESRPIGTGRSAIVHRVRRGEDVWARKVFQGDPLAKLVHLVLNGAPNPYTWNGDAIAAAVSRRRLLDALVRFWFDDDRLRLPALHGSSWNAEARA
jgi:hypothetical protein